MEAPISIVEDKTYIIGREWLVGRSKSSGWDELTGVNLGQVDPATLQATKIACGAHMCVLLGAIISEVCFKMSDEWIVVI